MVVYKHFNFKLILRTVRRQLSLQIYAYKTAESETYTFIILQPPTLEKYIFCSCVCKNIEVSEYMSLKEKIEGPTNYSLS